MPLWLIPDLRCLSLEQYVVRPIDAVRQIHVHTYDTYVYLPKNHVPFMTYAVRQALTTDLTIATHIRKQKTHAVSELFLLPVVDLHLLPQHLDVEQLRRLLLERQAQVQLLLDVLDARGDEEDLAQQVLVVPVA